MHIASNAYTASRENTSRLEGSKKELSLKTTTTSGNENIKQTLSESGPENVLANKGYARTRTFAVGQAKRAVLAFSEEKQRVDGFVLNKDQQLVPIQPHDLPKELKAILNSDAFEAFLKDIHARLTQLSNGDFRLDLHQGLKGGVYRADGDVEYVKTELGNISSKATGGRHEARVVIQNESRYVLQKTNQHRHTGDFGTSKNLGTKYPEAAFHNPDKDVYVISPGAAGGIFYDSTPGTPYGATGYISLRVITPGRNYIVVCAFSTSFSKRNAARILISATEGNSDELGRILGHGIDPTGEAPGVLSFFTRHIGKRTTETSFSGHGGMFDVYCRFDNQIKGNFIFRFTNPWNSSVPVNPSRMNSYPLNPSTTNPSPLVQNQIDTLNARLVELERTINLSPDFQNQLDTLNARLVELERTINFSPDFQNEIDALKARVQNLEPRVQNLEDTLGEFVRGQTQINQTLNLFMNMVMQNQPR